MRLRIAPVVLLCVVISLCVVASSLAAAPAPKPVTLALVAEPAEGGSVAGGGSYAHGAVATISAVANPGWFFVQWDGPVDDPYATTTSLQLDHDVTVTAIFSSQTWYEDDDPAIQYQGEWDSYSAPQASAGHCMYSGKNGSAATLTFVGTGIKLYTFQGPIMGKVKITIDGGPPIWISLYRRQVVPLTLAKLDLTRGTHTARLEVMHKMNPDYRGAPVVIDAVEVVP